jgi:hypothetical protein
VLARRELIEAWTYRMPARVSRKHHDRNENLSPAIRDIARGKDPVVLALSAAGCGGQAESRGHHGNRP